MTDVVVPVILVFLIPLLAVAYVFDHQSKLRDYRSRIAQCERGNVVRTQINDIADHVRFQGAKLELTVCETTYEKPRWFWQ